MKVLPFVLSKMCLRLRNSLRSDRCCAARPSSRARTLSHPRVPTHTRRWVPWLLPRLALHPVVAVGTHSVCRRIPRRLDNESLWWGCNRMALHPLFAVGTRSICRRILRRIGNEGCRRNGRRWFRRSSGICLPHRSGVDNGCRRRLCRSDRGPS